jgi:type IV pilus assembly protein PilP
MIKKLLQNNSLSSVIFVILVCLLPLAACSKDQAQAPGPVPVQPSAAAIPPKPVLGRASSALHLAPAPLSQFDFGNRKDPFKPFMVVKAESTKSPESIKKALINSLPIHSFDVNQFKLIGIITSGRENKAMVTDPGGKGYVLKVGMSIGKNDGTITLISINGVDVLEQFKDDNGRVRKVKVTLTLPRKQ